MKTVSLFESMPQWTPEQLLAIHECCQIVADAIWQQHGEQLTLHIRQEEEKMRAVETESAIEENLELPFEDEPPF